MKKIYFLFLVMFSAGLANAQNNYPVNDIDNNSNKTVVSLSAFSAERTPVSGIHLSWVSTNESNMLSYEIEKSANGSAFNPLGTIVPQNEVSPHTYTYTDGTPVEGYNYYRLRSTDKNGKIALSRIVKVDNSYHKANFAIIPNPVKNGVLNMQLTNLDAGKYNITLYGSGGQKVFARSFNYSAGSAMETVYLPQSLARGLYYLQINNGETFMNKQIMIQ